MLSAKGIRNACPRCNSVSLFSLSRNFGHSASFPTLQRVPVYERRTLPRTNRVTARSFSAYRSLRQEEAAAATGSSGEDIEKVVRDAKQRFRDTLPKGYLSDEEYALYERLYGPPLRETAPEDVGINTHADMGPAEERPENERVLLRELEGGKFEEVTYEIAQEIAEAVNAGGLGDTPMEANAQDIIEAVPGYVEAVARSQRERDALQALQKDFEAARKEQQEQEDEAAEEEEEEALGDEEEAVSHWPPEQTHELVPQEEAETGRFHRYTLEGRFHGNPVEVLLPQEELILPIRELLERTHLDHVKAAAELAFGGAGLPTSPATPEYKKNGQMVGVGLPPDQRHMTEIEADAFLAGYMPPAYASVLSILREVRKRVGTEWLRSGLESGNGLSVLDAGTGGAGLIAWEQVLQAEWDAMAESGKVEGKRPASGKKSVVVGSDRLRQRTKTFLHNTSFLPRIPDYEHSGEMQGERLDAGDQPQARKSYDVVIASHLFLKEAQDHQRSALLNRLWSLVNKNGGILIVLEKAHPRGFEAMAEVRDTVLKKFLLPDSGNTVMEPDPASPLLPRELEPGHIIAPCTTQTTCPMYTTSGKSTGRKDYCHFSQRFVRPMFHTKLLGNDANPQGEVEFSYVAIRRGVSKGNKATGKEATEAAFDGFEKSSRPDMRMMPRILSPALKRKGHVTLDVCTAEGKAERWTVPKSFSHLAYHDARKSRWGDLWALGAKTRVPAKIRAGSGFDVDAKIKQAKQEAKRRPRQAHQAAALESLNPKRTKARESKEVRMFREAMEVERLQEEMVEQQIDEEFKDIEKERTKGGQ